MADQRKTTIALFNYGGGMRGLITAHFMARLEEKTGLRMVDMIDIFAGPSTGAILNTALNIPHPDNPDRPKYRARHMVRFYEREGINIFPPDQFRAFRGIIHDFNNRTLNLSQLNWLFRHGHYDPSYLQKSLDGLYGGTRLADTLRTLIIPTYNIDGEQFHAAEEKDETGDSPARTKNNFMDEGGHAVWLKNIKLDEPPGEASRTPDVLLRDAIMASCAAPTYFPCHHFELTYPDKRGRRELTAIDGSIFDNPCISYIGAIRRHVPKDHRLIMIVMGTGYTNRSFKKDDWNRFGVLGVVDPVNDLPLINIFFHASESALMDAFEDEMGDNLYIFNKSMIQPVSDPEVPSTQIDDASPENLKRLRGFFETILEENKSGFEEVCDLLVKNYERKNKEKSSAGKKSSSGGKYLKLLRRKEKTTPL